MTLTQIETAITAGSAATGEMILILDDGTNTKVYFDAAAQTDAGSGAGLILPTLNGLTGVRSQQTISTLLEHPAGEGSPLSHRVVFD